MKTDLPNHRRSCHRTSWLRRSLPAAPAGCSCCSIRAALPCAISHGASVILARTRVDCRTRQTCLSCACGVFSSASPSSFAPGVQARLPSSRRDAPSVCCPGNRAPHEVSHTVQRPMLRPLSVLQVPTLRCAFGLFDSEHSSPFSPFCRRHGWPLQSATCTASAPLECTGDVRLSIAARSGAANLRRHRA